MYPVSSRFLQAIRVSHRMVAYVDVTTEEERFTVPVHSGSVSIDRTADVRRSGDAELITAHLASHHVARLRRINPYNSRVAVWRGVRFGDGIEELVPLGQFVVDQVTWGRDDSLLDVSLLDETSLVKNAAMPFSATVTSTSTLSVISGLLNGVHRGLTDPLLATDNLTVTGVTDAPLAAMELGDDRWESVSTLAEALGAEVWADPTQPGKWRVAPVPDLDAAPVWRVDYGDDGVLTDYSRTLERAGVRNAIVARHESQGSASGIYAIAQDTAVDSPTAISRFGLASEVIESAAFDTVVKCQRAADSRLRNSLGLLSNLDLSTVPNPALDAGDVIAVDFPTSPIVEHHIIDGLSIPLSPDGDFSLTTRATSVSL